jgi:phage baseplate assembly protein W
MKTARIYKDLDLSFTPLPGSGDAAKKYDVNAVKQSLRILLLTANGERPFNYLLGSPIYRMLFEPMDMITANMLETQITILITNQEPRVRLNKVEVIPNEDLNRYDITLYFYVVGLPEPVVYSTFLKRLR